MAEEKVEETKTSALLERLFSAGAHFGYSRSRRHPSVSRYIFGTKNNTELFDLEKTSELLSKAKSFIEDLGSQGKIMLIVGGKNEARATVKQAAEELHMPYVAGRWIGGTLTNFPEIRKRITRLEELVEKREKGEFESRYTKRERLLVDREIGDLKEHFAGLIPLKELPQALFVIDSRREHTAVREARQKGIPIVALMNSDCDLAPIDYPIIGNDALLRSIELFVGEVVEAYKQGLARRKERQEATDPSQSADAHEMAAL